MSKLLATISDPNSKKYTITLPKFKAVCHTDGKGFWSKEKRKILLTKAELVFYHEEFSDFICQSEKAHGELRVYFSIKSWNYNKYGLIYTDRLFVRELRVAFKNYGLNFKPSDLDYTEQGMQGDDYVSLDVEGKFLTSLAKKFKALTIALI